MVHSEALRRLRTAGIVAVGAIALMVATQAAVLEWRFVVVPVQTRTVAQSALRRALAVDVLYRAARAATDPAQVSALERATTALEREPQDDLTATEAASYRQFVRIAHQIERAPHDRTLALELQTVGPALVAAYDRATSAYVENSIRDRAASRSIVLTACAVIVIVLTLLYIFVMRARESSIERVMEELEARRQRFGAMFDNASEMMCLYDRDGNITRANRTALVRLGFAADAVGLKFDVHVAPEHVKQAAVEFAAAAAGRSLEFSSVFIDSQGNEIPVVGSLAPIIVNGKIEGVVGSARDVTVERRFEQELLRSNERFRSLFASSPNSILSVDVAGIVTDANAAFERLTGYRAVDIVGQSFTVVVPPGNREGSRTRFQELLSGPARSYEAVALTKDGRELSVGVDATPIRVGGRVEGIFYTSHDLGSERALRRQVDEFDERLATLLQVAGSSWSGGAQIDEALFLGASALQMSHGFVVEIDGSEMQVQHRHGADDVLPVGYRMPVTQSIGGRLTSSERAVAVDDLTVEPYAAEMRERRLPWCSYIGSRLIVDGDPYGALLFLDTAKRESGFKPSDIDFIDVLSSMVTTAISRELRGKRLHERAMHDKLTGLANQAGLEEHFARAAARARRGNEIIAVVYIDLDGFKPVNDVYGHAAGDEVLKAIAHRFGLAVRAHDVVTRLGGDEFVILETAISKASDVEVLIERIHRFLEKPITLSSGTGVTVGASVGVALFPKDGEDLQHLLQVADAAMYRNKHLRREKA